MTARARWRAGPLVIAVVLAASPPAAAYAAATTPEAGSPPARILLERAVDASRERSFEGRLLVATLGVGGPSVTEAEVAQSAGGALQVRSSEAWVVGRDDDAAYMWQIDAGTLLRFGDVEPASWSLAALLRKYAVRRVGAADLRTGEATELALRERGADQDRERLFVDAASDLIVRRETYDRRGDPVRVVAYTALEVAEPTMASPPTAPTEDLGGFEPLSPDGLDILGRTGWEAPSRLPAGFVLRAGYAVPGSQRPTLHLVYSDGLYTLSVYQEVGRLDHAAVEGAVAIKHGGLHVWHWPGAEPSRMMWTGDGLTFSVVSDAPGELTLDAVAAFPSEATKGLPQRLWRGVSRVAGWLWPFG